MQWLEISARLIRVRTLKMGMLDYKLKQFVKGYSRVFVGASSENKIQLFPNLLEEVHFDFNRN